MLVGPEVSMIKKLRVKMHDCLVSWLSKRQTSISLSIAEAEYIATADCCTQILWMKKALKNVNIDTNQPITIYFDNISAINLKKKFQ